jgi:hypothetical protein
MNQPSYDHLRESNWRRKLTSGEKTELRAWLAAHPEMESDWEAEAGLSNALGRLPDAEVPTNFTARVLSRIDGMEPEAAAAGRSVSGWTWSWRSLLPRAAVVLIALAAGLYSYERQQAARRTEIAHDLAAVSRVAAVPGPEALRDFETIRHLNQTASPDEQLLVLLQ